MIFSPAFVDACQELNEAFGRAYVQVCYEMAKELRRILR